MALSRFGGGHRAVNHPYVARTPAATRPPLLTGCRVVMLIHVFESVGLAGALPSEIGGVG